MKLSDSHWRNSYLKYTTREMYATRVTQLEKNLQNIKSSFHKRIQILLKKVKSQDLMLNEMEGDATLSWTI